MADLIDRQALLRDIEKYHLSDGKFQHWVEVQPSVEADVPDTTFGNMISRQAEIERIDRIFRDLNIACAYDMPSFWYNKGKDYAVIPTKYHKGYQRALEDAEARIMDALKDGEQDG